MSLLNFISLLAGLAMFLYGITLMSDSLNLVAGNKLELVLYRLTSKRVRGIFLGVVVTAVIQSSSASSVMCIGFVNAGLMQFRQAVSVILGSILGTSITGWIICLSQLGGSGWAELLSTAALTGLVAVAGTVLKKFSKSQTRRHVGDILMGFAVLMFGMNAMSAAVEPLRDSESFLRLMVTLSNPLLGVLAGAAFTAIIQSSAAAVGILQALSLTGALSFAEAFPLLLGIAIGGALPVMLGAIGAKVNGVRTAVAHLIIDVVGALLCGVLFYTLHAMFHFSFLHRSVSIVEVAALNTAFRLATVLLLAPAIGLIDKLSARLVPARSDPGEEDDMSQRLEDRFIQYPAVALEQSHLAMLEMAELVRTGLQQALALQRSYSAEVFRSVCAAEERVDRAEDAIGSYLLRISPTEFTREQNENLHKYLHCITDFECISDHARDLAKAAQERHEKKLQFSEACEQDLQVLYAAVEEVCSLTLRAFTEDDCELARRVEPLEEAIDALCEQLSNRHIERLRSGVCTLRQGLVFNDILTACERVSDHCSNIALAMIELANDLYDTHDLQKQPRDELFYERFEEYRRQYSV